MNQDEFWRKYRTAEKKIYFSESKMKLAYEKYQFLVKSYVFDLKEYNALKKIKERVDKEAESEALEILEKLKA